jgi:DNA-binding GntR family transcriptional regulator
MAKLDTTPAPRARTAKDYIYQQLTVAFLEGRFAPGERLLEKEISEWLDVSRTPVREALSSLEADGLVELIPHKGAVVRRLSAEDVRDQYIVRAALESLATELAVPHVDAARLKVLNAAKTEFARAHGAGDVEEALAANKTMHMTLYQACGSARLIEAIESAWRRADYFRRFVYASQDGTSREDSMHTELLKAVKQGDSQAAANIVKRSLLESGDSLAEEMSQMADARSSRK